MDRHSVYIIHTFDSIEGVKARIIESWLEYYFDYGKLKNLLVQTIPDHHQRWTILRRLLRRIGPPPSNLTSEDQLQPQFSVEITMADLGRADSLDRNSFTDLTVLDGDGADIPENQELRRQRLFIDAFRSSAKMCNTFFITECQRLEFEYSDVLLQLQAAQKALTTISKQKQSLSNFHATEVWEDIRHVYKNLHKEIRDMRSFSRTNFDLSIRLVKSYRKVAGRGSHVASGIWRYLRKLDFSNDKRLFDLTISLEQNYADAFSFGFLTLSTSPLIISISQLRKLDFTNDKRLFDLTLSLEQNYADAFSFGFIGLAHKELYGAYNNDWHVFRVGLRFGVTLVLLCWVLWNAVFDSSKGINLFRHPIINVYAAVGGLLLLCWLWALNLVVWERVGVDYKAILGFKNPLMTVEQIYSEVSIATTLYLANLLVYYKLLRGVAGPFQALPSHFLPILMVMYCVYKRKEVWLMAIQIIAAPLGEVGFKELFFADMLTSFNKVSYEAVMGGCYMLQDEYIEDHMGGRKAPPMSAVAFNCGPNSLAQRYLAPLAICFPLWLRLLQCLRRYYMTSLRVPPLPNAVKYGISMSVVLFGIFNPQYAHGGSLNTNDDRRFTAYEFFWILSYTITTFGTWLWDVIMDWGLFQNRYGLRQHLLFRRHVWVYYTAIILDLILRFLWTVSLLPEATSGYLASFQLRVRFFIPALELFRRSMWSWLRLEREQTIRDVHEGTLNEAKRKKRETRNKAERNRRLEKISAEVLRLVKATHKLKQHLKQDLEDKKAKKQIFPLHAVARGGVGAGGVDGAGSSSTGVGGESVESAAVVDGGGGGGGQGTVGLDTSRANSSNAGSVEYCYESDDDDQPCEEEGALEAQKVLQRDLVSHRSVIIEVSIVLATFVAMAAWAAKAH